MQGPESSLSFVYSRDVLMELEKIRRLIKVIYIILLIN